MLADIAPHWEQNFMKKGFSLGKQEGISIGEAQGVRSVLQALLQSRFGVLPQDVTASLATFSDVGALQRLTLEVYRVESLPAFRALPAQTVKAKKPL